MHHMTKALRRLPPQEEVCYRGVFFEQGLEQAFSEYTPGSIVQWDGFSSTSTDFEVAKYFAGDPVIFKIAVCDGRDLKDLTMVPGESELLLTPMCHFFVTEPPYYRDDFLIIEMEQAAAAST
jgi:hypothetical protein